MGKLQGRMGLCTWVCSVLCAACFGAVFCALVRCVCTRMQWFVRRDALCVRVWVRQGCGRGARSPERTSSFSCVC